MRLLAQPLLPANSPLTFVQGEVAQQETPLTAPRAGKRFHLFCSSHNLGAYQLVQDLAEMQSMRVVSTQVQSELEQCERMLVYLNDNTWTSDATSEDFANDVKHAMDLGVPLQLVHEMPGLGQEERPACPFDNFFACDRGATPTVLLNRGIYDQIAIALKGGEWRKAGMVMLARAIIAPVQDVVEEKHTRRKLAGVAHTPDDGAAVGPMSISRTKVRWKSLDLESSCRLVECVNPFC